MAKPAPGDLWRYDYLWRWQQDSGETEGRKPRPVTLVAVMIDRDGKTNLFILPITSFPPATGRLALKVPQMERRRAGLDDDKPSWIILDEYNHDLLEQSYYFDPNARLGGFSAAFLQKALSVFVRAAKEKRIQRVPRR